MSHGVRCLVRPGKDDTGEGQDESDYQDGAYRKAWEPFNPDQEEDEGQEERSKHEADMLITYAECQRSGAMTTPKAPTAQ